MTYFSVLLDASYHKKNFSCGKKSLDNYIKNQASQDMRRKLSVCFIVPDENKNIKAYYTLSSGTIPQEEFPEEIKKKMPPSYNNLPTTLLGRLAVDIQYKGQGLGEMILLDALKRSLDVSNESIASMAVVVDPLDEEAFGFYKKYGFIELPDSGKMFLPMKTVGALFR